MMLAQHTSSSNALAEIARSLARRRMLQSPEMRYSLEGMGRHRCYVSFAQLLHCAWLCLGCEGAGVGGHSEVPGLWDAGAASPVATDAPTDTDASAPGAPVRDPASGQPAFCAREGRQDYVRDLFCAPSAPTIDSLLSLQRALHFVGDAGTEDRGYPSLVFLAHSTALSGEVVSQLNPRAILGIGGDFMAFSRGVQQAEVIALDHDTNKRRLNFYLFRFQQACNQAAAGCSREDLYTPRIESDWTHVSVEDDEELKNTPDDCRQCHQRGQANATLLMRELDGPWTHFFGPDQDDPASIPEPSGSALLRDYLRAKGDEPYANVASPELRNTVGFTLQRRVESQQPLVFDGSTILNERWPWHNGYAAQPVRSRIWDLAYARFKRGEQLALPYFAPRATDPDKLQQLTAAYTRYREGALSGADFPDLTDIYPDDLTTRAEIGLNTDPSSSPAEVLIQACGTCHNDVLDQSLSRARFSVALGRMSRAERDLAIARLQLGSHVPGAMPPSGRRRVLEAQLPALIAYLQQDARAPEDDEQLEHAASLGMAGPSAN